MERRPASPHQHSLRPGRERAARSTSQFLSAAPPPLGPAAHPRTPPTRVRLQHKSMLSGVVVRTACARTSNSRTHSARGGRVCGRTKKSCESLTATPATPPWRPTHTPRRKCLFSSTKVRRAQGRCAGRGGPPARSPTCGRVESGQDIPGLHPSRVQPLLFESRRAHPGLTKRSRVRAQTRSSPFTTIVWRGAASQIRIHQFLKSCHATSLTLKI